MVITVYHLIPSEVCPNLSFPLWCNYDVTSDMWFETGLYMQDSTNLLINIYSCQEQLTDLVLMTWLRQMLR